MKMLLGFMTTICLLLAQPVLAGFPDWYPKDGFQHYGKVDDVDAANKSLIINDREYHYTDKTLVHSLSEPADSLGRLRKSAMVGFTYDMSSEGAKQLLEVWLLPENYSRDEDN